jgi:molybdopterin molybdotransferase
MMSVLSFPDALTTVLTHTATLRRDVSVEDVALLAAQGRVLAKPLHADRDQPPFHRSTRDGYAVRATDLDKPLKVVGSIRAGESWAGEALGESQAIEIMTGAPVPEGADAVLMLEHVSLNGGVLRGVQMLRVGDNIVPRGVEAQAGGVVLRGGGVIGAAEIAVAASCGAMTLAVFAKPSVAIVATGDELVEVSESPAPHQIRNSNSYSLAALVAAEGAAPRRLAIARDTHDDLRARLDEAKTADLVLFSGGVSAGKFDLVEQVLAEARAEFFFTGALIQPGKPVVFGRIPRGDDFVYFFGLPGNPISTQVCFHLFVAPLLRAFCGRTDLAPRFVEAKLAGAVKGGAKVTRFLPAEISSAWDGVEVTVLGWQGSGDIATNARANGYAVLPAGVEQFLAGETVRVLLR